LILLEAFFSTAVLLIEGFSPHANESDFSLRYIVGFKAAIK